MTLHSHDIRHRDTDDNRIGRASDPLSPKTAQASVPLADFASVYTNGVFCADLVSPIRYTDDITGTYYKFAQKDSTTELDNIVGELGAINEVTIESTTGSYTCIGYGLRGPVSRQLQAVADEIVDPKRRVTQNIMHRNLLSREIRVANQITTSGNWASGATTAASAVWSDQTSGTPLTDIQTALESVPASNGLSRKIGVCALEVFHDLVSHPQIRDLHGTAPGQITHDVLAGYLGLDQLIVSDAQKNTANTGVAVSMSRVWLATVFAIVLVPASPGPDQECFSATIRRNLSGGSNGILVREWYEPGQGTEGTDHIAVTHEDDEVIVRNDAGHLLTSVRA